MKRRPNLKQWNELSLELKTKFRSIVPVNKWLLLPGMDELELIPDIGEMIEFLGDNWMSDILPRECTCEELIPVYFPKNKNLCNYLWEACKYKLRQKYEKN